MEAMKHCGGSESADERIKYCFNPVRNVEKRASVMAAIPEPDTSWGSVDRQRFDKVENNSKRYRV
jgi:hypothetical protein